MDADATPGNTSTAPQIAIPGKGTASVSAPRAKEKPKCDHGWVGERRKEKFLEIATVFGEENVQDKCYTID
jgi:hypothetical protein